MGKYYRLFVITTGITKEQIYNICLEEFGWDGEISLWKGEFTFDGEGYLCDEMTEKKAHDRIYKALKKINPNAKIKTHWTCMEDLPYEEYGDDID